MTSPVTLYAGTKAYNTIRQHGIQQQLFSTLVGASGGPKWFVLAALDRYLCGDFFAARTRPLATLSSSAGAWRFACYAQSDPVAAVNRLIDGYAHLTYPQKASKQDVNAQSEQLLKHVLAADGAMQIANNPLLNNHIVVARSKGFSRYENRLLQAAGLVRSALANHRSRQALSHYYQRVVFSQQLLPPPFDYDDGIDSKQVILDQNNAYQALLATGAIPLLLSGVRDIPGAGPGMYRDGGLIDYHFDQRFLATPSCINTAGKNIDGLVLYPHFYQQFKPGWFDKYVPNRFSQPAHFDNVLVISPSEQFVASLPHKKIPDRTDFKTMSNTQRIDYFLQVVKHSERIADEFARLCQLSPEQIPLQRI